MAESLLVENLTSISSTPPKPNKQMKSAAQPTTGGKKAVPPSEDPQGQSNGPKDRAVWYKGGKVNKGRRGGKRPGTSPDTSAVLLEIALANDIENQVDMCN